jgi:cell division transport system permease protein
MSMKRKIITGRRIVSTGFVNFFRNASLAIAAMAVMVVTLTIILLSIVVNTTLSGTIAQITNKIDVSVYLKDTVTPQQREKLTRELEKQPNVVGTEYLSKEDALEAYKKENIDNAQLLLAINQTDNPLPATIRVQPRDLEKVQEIQAFLDTPEMKALQSEEPSYSGDRKEAIDKISHAANVLQKIGIAGIVLFAVISVLIIFNTIQMAIFNRRDEISIMRLLGAKTWYIRGPYVVESVMYGVISGLISIFIINSLFVASSEALQASSLGLLDIKYAHTYFRDHFWLLLLLQLTIGVVIGAVSSTIATRRYLKFKTSKR